MANLDLDKKYRELFPEAASQIKTLEVKPEVKTEMPEVKTDLDAKYQKLFKPEEYQAPKVEEAPKEERISAYTGPDIVDRRKEPFWRKAAKFILPKKAEELLGLDKPMPEKTAAQKMREQGKVLEEYYGKGEDLLGGIKVFGEGLTKLPKALASAILQATQGSEGASVVDKDWADRFIEDANQDLNKFIYETQEKYRDKLLISGLPLKITHFAEFPQNLAFSLTSMGAGLAVGGPIALIPAPGMRVVAWTLGTAASGKVAYDMTTYQIMQLYLEAQDEEKREKTGEGITAEEEENYRDLFGAKAMEYGLWEAVPEALSNLAFVKILTTPLLKMGINKTIVGRMTTKLSVLYGEELLTETVTQKGQARIEVGAGLREEDIGWIQAFQEVAPQTFLLTTVMGGVGSVVIKTKNAIFKSKESLKKEIGTDHPKFKELSEKIEEKITSDRAVIEEIVTPEQVIPKKVTPEIKEIALTAEELKPLIEEKAKIIPIDQARQKFEETGTADIIIGEEYGIGVKDEGEGFIQVILGPIKLTEVGKGFKGAKSFTTKEEAFAFAKKLQDIYAEATKEIKPVEVEKPEVKEEKIEPQPINMVNLNKRTDLELRQGQAYYLLQRDETYKPEDKEEILADIQKDLDLINAEIKRRAEVKPVEPKVVKPTPALDLAINERVEVFDEAGKKRGTGIVLKVEEKSVIVKDDFSGLPVRYSFNFEFREVEEPVEVEPIKVKPKGFLAYQVKKFESADKFIKSITDGMMVSLEELPPDIARAKRRFESIKATQTTRDTFDAREKILQVAITKVNEELKGEPFAPIFTLSYKNDEVIFAAVDIETMPKGDYAPKILGKEVAKIKSEEVDGLIKQIQKQIDDKLIDELVGKEKIQLLKEVKSGDTLRKFYARVTKEIKPAEIKREIPKELKGLANLAGMTSKERFRKMIHEAVESKEKTTEEEKIVDSLLYLEEMKLSKPFIESFWDLVQEIKPAEIKVIPKKKEEVEPEKVKAVPEPEKKENMPKAYLTAKKAMGKSSTLPILESFVVKKGKLTATDLEIGVRLNTDLKDGSYKVVGKDAVKADFPVEDFPVVPEVKGKLVGKILSENLADALKLANLSKSKDTSGIRPALAAVSLEIKNKRMNVVATDSFRLFRKMVSMKAFADVKMLIEATKLPKILADMKSVVEIYNDKEMVYFRGKFGDISVKKFEGEFPEYQMAYPEINERYAFDRKQFLNALKEIKPFVDIFKRVTLTYKDGNLELSAKNEAEKISKKITISARKDKVSKINAESPNDGVVVMEIREDTKPKADHFYFNVKYLIDAVTSLEEERIFIYSATDLAPAGKLFSEMAELKSVAKPKGTANATIGKFREGEEVELANMDKVKPIEFPELLELTRDLMGRVPEVSRRLRTALGKFYAIEKGRIKLTPEIFKNEAEATRVLAHEIGHLIDYLPHQTLKRGNLLGSLLSLRHFLKNQFGEVDIKNDEIREELKGVTKYWRPYEEAESTPSYISYRNSARELYADAISVLFNTPGTLERLAPKFFNEFFNALDAKPEVKNAYFDIQEVLSHDRATLIALRRERTREMFDRADYKSEELQKVKEEERKLGLKDYWNKFTYTIRSINQPVYKKVSEAEARGEHIPDDENPKYLLSARNYLAGQIKAEFEENVAPVMKDLEEHGIDWKTFGEFLLYERITEGDRSEFANPGGIMPRDAKERITSLKTAHGENFSAIETNAAKFRKFLKSVGERAYGAGLFSKEMFDLIKGNEKYVPFQVVEYMDHYVSWKSKAQVGTLKDVNNPANSLILKVISTIRAIENQKNKVATFKMLEKSFPDEIKEAELQFTGRAQRPVESRDIRLGMVTYYEDGKLRGKYVDKYIAKGLEKDSIARNKAVMTVLSPVSFLNRKLFRPLFVIYNPGWIPFNFIRDYMRFWKNTPGLSFIRAAKRYGQAFRASKVRAFGEKEGRAKDAKARELIRELEKSKLLSVTWNDILSGQTYEDVQIEAVMQKIGLAESKKEIPAFYKPFETFFRKTKLIDLLQGIRKMGDLVETLPKIAGYYELKGKMKPNEMREFIRKNIGSPDFFEKGYLTPATNNVFLFSNAFIQAVTADFHIATNPTTRSGFWWKTAKTIYVPKILMFAALMGAFGDELKKLYEDASEYDMTNYLVVPLGRDTSSGKTTYLRIPTDETSRLLGALLWKVMRGASNDQKFGRDVADVVSLFGGQLPGISPAIQAPLNIFQFAAGQNPYDTFRGRLALTEEQMQAGGWYALKPFLTWQFQQMGGGIFVKMYAGEQIPREKSAGEKFLQLPVLSNVIGRFIKISDYGQLEKYRAKMYEIKGEKARERIDEDKIINDYIKKYQAGEGEIHELSQDLILDVLGHAVSNREEKLKSVLLRKKFKISIEKGKADPKVNALISAVSNEEKVTLMRVYKEIMSEEDFVALRTELLKYKIISVNVLRLLNQPFQP